MFLQIETRSQKYHVLQYALIDLTLGQFRVYLATSERVDIGEKRGIFYEYFDQIFAQL